MSLRSRTVDVLFTGLEGIASLYDFVRRMRAPRTRESATSQPLSHRDVEHQQAQIRTATSGGKLTILPPPRKTRSER